MYHEQLPTQMTEGLESPPPPEAIPGAEAPTALFLEDEQMLARMTQLAAAKRAETAEERNNEVFRLKRDPNTYEVHVESDVTLEDYRRITPEDDWKLMESWARPLEGKSVVFLNPTMEGGGVAMLRPPLVHC